MDFNHVLGMICGYYLSRFDQQAYAHLGYATQQATHQALGAALNVPPESIKNWRDEFDPVHDNARKGWHRREMYPSRRRVIEALGEMTEPEFFKVVQQISADPSSGAAEDLVKALAVTEPDDAGNAGSFSLRGPTGVRAEETYRLHHGQTGEPVNGKLVDRRQDQCGFDFEIVTDSGSVVVEVKGLAGRTGGITFTDKEWATAQERGDEYYLAIVWNIASTPELLILRNPAVLLDARMRTYTTIQIGWSVGDSSLKRVAAGRRLATV
jgi:hypothetical protein